MKQLVDLETGKILLPAVEVADSFWTRFRGLQLRSSLPMDQGLFLAPCSSLHTCFMRFPIDIIMLDKDNRVLGHRRNIKPWKLVFCVKRTASVLETRVDALPELVGNSVLLK